MVEPVITTPAEIPQIPQIPLPAKYVALGLMTGYHPIALKDARLYVTGLSGEGKSTFLSSIPNAWVIDFEKGVGSIACRRGAYFNISEIAMKTGKSKYDVYRAIIDNLIGDGKAGKRPCARVIFDTHDEWAALETSNFLNEKSKPTKMLENIGEYGTKGSGHAMVQGRCKRRPVDLEDAGYTWAVVGHLTYTIETGLDGKESSALRPVLSKVYVAPVRRLSELWITINSKTTKERVPVVYNTGDGKEVTTSKEQQVTRYNIFTRSNETKSISLVVL